MFEELNIEEAKLCAILIKKEEYMQLIQQKIDTRWIEILKARNINKQKQRNKEIILKISLRMKETFKRALLKEQPKKKNFTREEQKEKEKKNYRRMKGRNIKKRKIEQALEKLKEETRPIVHKKDQELIKEER